MDMELVDSFRAGCASGPALEAGRWGLQPACNDRCTTLLVALQRAHDSVGRSYQLCHNCGWLDGLDIQLTDTLILSRFLFGR